VAQINHAAFAALKPGGVYFIIDHAAVAGSPISAERNSLHCIDQAAVRREVKRPGLCSPATTACCAIALIQEPRASLALRSVAIPTNS
jgi:predicted methyltransferase